MKIMSNTIRIFGMDFRGSVCDGPGIRGVVFLQGCTRHCHNCHNQETWDIDSGEVLSVKELIINIEKLCPFRRITISGGEPMLQVEALNELVTGLWEKGYEVALYTSYSKDKIPESILDKLTYIKTEPYIEELHTTIVPYVGSSNQLFEKLR